MIVPTFAWKLQQANEEYRQQLVSFLLYKYKKEERTTQIIQTWDPKQQLDDLLVKPLNSIPKDQSGNRKVILVIDALEECLHHDRNSDTGLIGQLLRGLLSIVKENACPSLKVIISSPSGETSYNARRIANHLEESAMDGSVASYSMTNYQLEQENQTVEEMKAFYKKELSCLESPDNAWLSDDLLAKLSEITRGNFLLAGNICRQTRKAKHPRKFLEKGVRKDKFMKNLEKHYQKLASRGAKYKRARKSRRYWNAIHTIVLWQSLMQVEDVAEIIEYPRPEKLRSTLLAKRALESVVFIPTVDPLRALDVIRVHDAIFMDYVRTGRVHRRRVLWRSVRIDQSVLQCDLAANLLRLLNKRLCSGEQMETSRDSLPPYSFSLRPETRRWGHMFTRKNINGAVPALANGSPPPAVNGGMNTRQIQVESPSRVIEYASCFWWRHLQLSYDNISSIATRKNNKRLEKSQKRVIKELSVLLNDDGKYKQWSKILAKSSGIQSPLLALTTVRTFLMVSGKLSQTRRF